METSRILKFSHLKLKTPMIMLANLTDGSNKKRDDDTSNDTKDADVTTKAEDGSESANDSTQEKQMVSQSGNFSKLEKFP